MSPIGYKPRIEVRRTEEFTRWLRHLRDANAVARIVARISPGKCDYALDRGGN